MFHGNFTWILSGLIKKVIFVSVQFKVKVDFKQIKSWAISSFNLQSEVKLCDASGKFTFDHIIQVMCDNKLKSIWKHEKLLKENFELFAHLLLFLNPNPVWILKQIFLYLCRIFRSVHDDLQPRYSILRNINDVIFLFFLFFLCYLCIQRQIEKWKFQSAR